VLPSATEVAGFRAVNFMKGLSFKWGWGAILFLSLGLEAEPLKYQVKGEAVILINAESGSVLFEHNAWTPRYPASTTKVATALYVLKEHSDKLDEVIIAEQDSLVSVTQEAKCQSAYTLPGYWLEPDGTHIAIKKGEAFSLRVLLQGMLIPSGNDAANVIAQALGPGIPTFIQRMNAYLKEMGCQNTHFCNPHGLHDPKHQSTAYDLAMIAQEALRFPLFCDIVSQPRFFRPKTNKQPANTLLQTNRLLRPGQFHYSKAIGVKTGYHAKAKKNLIAAARSEGRTLIAVLLGYQDRDALFEEAIHLFEAAFNQSSAQQVFLKAGPQTFTLDLPKANHPIETYLPESLTLEYYPAEDPEATCLLYWRQLSLPISKDQEVGKVRLVSAQGHVLKQVALLSLNGVELAWPYRWFALLRSSYVGKLTITGLVFGLIFWLIIFILLGQKSARPSVQRMNGP